MFRIPGSSCNFSAVAVFIFIVPPLSLFSSSNKTFSPALLDITCPSSIFSFLSEIEGIYIFCPSSTGYARLTFCISASGVIPPGFFYYIIYPCIFQNFYNSFIFYCTCYMYYYFTFFII